MKGASEYDLTARLSRLEQRSNINLFLLKTCRDCINSVLKSCQVYSLDVRCARSECGKETYCRERLKGIDGKEMIPKCGWEVKKALCVRFLFVQPGVVSTCSVTERICFVNSFAAVFRKFVFEFVFEFFRSILRHVSKCMWGCDCWLFGQSLVCNFLENSTPAFFLL